MSKDFLEHKAFVELFDLHYGNLVGFARRRKAVGQRAY